MMSELDTAAKPCVGEPWGRRLWLAFAVVLCVTTLLVSYGMTTWPMADDEVPSLVEMGLFHVDASAFSVPASQIGRLARANIVWYASQGWLLERLPQGQLGYRLPSVVYAILAAGLAFLIAARWRGLRYAVALVIVLDGSQMFVLVSQLNRFYAQPLLLLTCALAVICAPSGGALMIPAAAVLAALTVLSHNITMPVFVLAFFAAVPAYLLGRVSRQLLVRSGVSALTGVALYLFYLRAIVQGWASTGNPTPVLVSYMAHVGIPVLAFGLLGLWFVASEDRSPGLMTWLAVMLGGSVCFLQLAPVSWNPRYFVFFMPPLWALAAHAIERLARPASRATTFAWYSCVILLLLPGLLSHFRDGSRHDYRAAAAVLASQAAPGEPILSDDAETISYYLPAALRQSLAVRTKVREPPGGAFFLVARSNAWADLPAVPGRDMVLLSQIATRRFDQFSHVLRVYRVAPRRID